MSISAKHFFKLDDTISEMGYQIGDNFDNWFPTKEDIETKVDLTTDEGLRFMLWCSHPRNEFALTPDQKDTLSYIKKQLYKIDLDYSDEEEM